MQAAADVSSPPSATTVWSRSRSAFGLEGGSSGGESPDSGATAAATAAAAAADIGGGSSSAITPVSAIGNDDTIICQRQNHHHHHNRTGSSSSRNSNSNSNSSHRRSQSSAGIGAETRDDGLETLNSTSLSSSRSAVPTEGLSPSPINKSDISGGGGGGESKAPGSSSPVAAAARKLASVVSSPSWLSHAQPVPPMPTLAPTAPAPPASFITSRTPGLTLAPMAAPPPKAPVPRYAKRKNKRDKPDGLAAVPFALASPSKKPADAEKSKKAQLQIPFFALIFVYMAVSSIAVGIVGWQFTISSAKSSVLDLSNKVQSLVAQEVVTAVGENANMITEMTTYQKDMFQKNKWSLTNGRGNTTVQSLLTFFKFFRQWAVNVLLITYPGGEVLGWHFPEDQSNATLTKIVQTGLTIAVYLCDYNGTPLRLMSNVTRLGDGTVANPGYNSTLSIMQNATYGYVNFSDPDYTRVSTIYAFSTGSSMYFFVSCSVSSAEAKVFDKP
ncbi:hypothetical protein DFJ73DRAFT_144593 [Zopfochytrium polystomum]|nr:hypothetical protein DFJ73DRAFT_144593 [Zopfochytrium polystomum]